MATLYLCGAGNSEAVRLALNINRHVGRWEQILLLDDDPQKHGRSVLGVPVVGGFEVLADADRPASEVANLVARTTARRVAARRRIEQYALPFVTLIHPGVDTCGVELGNDIIVYQNATIGPEVTVGDGSVVFVGAAVGHGSRVGRFCVVAGGAVLNARVQLGDSVYVGTNATVLPEVSVGRGATIGAGSVVVQDVRAGATVLGVPAELICGGSAFASSSRAGMPNRQVTRRRDQPPHTPRTWVEEKLFRIWCNGLGTTRVGLHENFLERGGTSLAMVQIAFAIKQDFGLDIPLRSLFQAPTIADMSALIERMTLEEAGDTALDHALREVEELSDEEADRLGRP